MVGGSASLNSVASIGAGAGGVGSGGISGGGDLTALDIILTGGGGKGAAETVGGTASLNNVASIGVGAGGVGSGSISGGGDLSALDMILTGGSGVGAGSGLVNGIGGNVDIFSGNAGVGQIGPGVDAPSIDKGRPSLTTDRGGPTSGTNAGGPSLIDVGGQSFDSVKLGLGGGKPEPAVNIGAVGGSGSMSGLGNGGINGGVDAMMGVLSNGNNGNGCGSGVGLSCGGMTHDIGGGSGRGDAGGSVLGNIISSVSGGSGGVFGATGEFGIDVGMQRGGGASAIGSDAIIHGFGNVGIGGIDLAMGSGGAEFGGIKTIEGLGSDFKAKYASLGNDGISFANVPQANIHGSIASGGPISISIPDIVIDRAQLQRMEGGSLSKTFPVPIGSGSSKSEVKVMVVVSVPMGHVGAIGSDGSFGASEGHGKVDFSLDQSIGGTMFDGGKTIDSNMTTTTLSPLKIDIDKSKDDEKLKTKIKLQRGNGDLARKAEIKVKQKLEDDEKVKIKIETKLPGFGERKKEIKLEGEVGMNIKVPGMDVGLNIQESGVKVIDLAKPKDDKSIVSSPTQFSGGVSGDSVGGHISGPGFGVPSMTDYGISGADPAVGGPSSQFSGFSRTSPDVMQLDLQSAPSSSVLFGPDSSPQTGPTDNGQFNNGPLAQPSANGPFDNGPLSQPLGNGPIKNGPLAQPLANGPFDNGPLAQPSANGPIDNGPLLQPLANGPFDNGPLTQPSAVAIASSSVSNIGPGRDAGPVARSADLLSGRDIFAHAVAPSVAQPVPIVSGIAFGPVQVPASGPVPLPVPVPETASASVSVTSPELLSVPVPGSDNGLSASSTTASKTTDDKKEKTDTKDGSRLKSALRDLIKALQNIKSTKVDLLSFNPDPISPASAVPSVAQTPAIEPMAASTHVISSGTESGLNQDFDGLCLGSIGTFVDGVGYAKYPGDCEKFLQCYYVGATVRPVIRKCPYGLFWDQALMLCRRPDDVFCPADPCFTGKKHYRREGGCNCYYQCVNGVSTPKCCGSGFKYDDNNECVSDNADTDKCDDQCETSDAVVQKLGSSTCNSMEDGSNIYGYINLEHGGLRFRACPFGTTYNPLECRCSARYSSSGSSLTVSKPRQRSCRPEFNMNFDDGFIDLSDGNTAFSSMGCFIDHGSVSFAGAGHMTLWGFTGRFYGTTFGMKMRVKPNTGSRKRSETIISNCGFDGEPTISICRENGKVKMTAIVTGSASPMVIEDLCDDDAWCDIVYYFNGKSFVGGVGKNRQSLACGGILKSNGNPLMIGGCNNGSGFNGLIDDVNIYTMCIPSEL